MEALLFLILVMLTWIFIMLVFICYFLHKATQLFRVPYKTYNRIARDAVTIRRKDVDMPIVKYAVAKVAVFVALRYVSKKLR